MNNRKSKAKKRKLSDLEESSSNSSSDKGEEIGSDVEDKNTGSDDESSSSESSHSSTESHSDSNIKQFRRKKTSADLLMTDSSESGDENCEKCAICLRSITSQQVGNPEGCDHLFCSLCIIEWSKNSNVCPLDRQQFSIILVRENKNGEIAKKVPVEESQAGRDEDVVFEDIYDTVCEVCGSGDREDILLLCDFCDRGFHTSCLTPPLESVPDENVWYCPFCEFRDSNFDESPSEFLDAPSTSRSLRPRIQMVRTRLLERIRVTVNRIVENYVSHHSDSGSSLDMYDTETLFSLFSSESESERTEVQPSTSVPNSAQSKKKKIQSKPRKRKVTKARKRGSKTTKKTTTRKKKTTSTKRKSTSAGKGKTKRRKTRVRTTRTKKVKVENADGTITEKIVKTRIYKRRRKQKKTNQKPKGFGAARRGLRVKSVTTPKTVKGRLALTLGMVPPKKPGQFLPDIKVRPPNSNMSSIDINRARAGIPKLHIFAPRDELQYYSSDSDQEDFMESSSGGVATVVPQRSNTSRFRDRTKAALAIQSMPPSTASKPKPIMEPPTSEFVDILGSIMDSQAVWHSKNTNVKINEDGSIEVIKDKDSDSMSGVAVNGTEKKLENNKGIDVREGKSEGLTTQAPMQPGTGSRPGGFRQNNRNTYGENRSGGQDNSFSPRSGQSSTGVNFNRFGAPARNDREGYTNYLNNTPQGPTPFCRGGPPLRFRMPPRQQLRRITIPVRNRPAWQRDEEEDEEEEDEENDKSKDKEKEKDGKEKKEEDIDNDQTKSKKNEDEEDIDLYSDIETNVEKGDNSGGEEEVSSYPALGPPPEPPAFLLGLEENGEFSVAENKDKSEVYDPAEPCDSEDEMVIDENKEQSPLPEKKEIEQKKEAPISPEIKTAAEPTVQKKQPSEDEDDDNDEDCPIFSIYSSATREFSQKEEEERQREIAEERRKIEKLKLREEQKSYEAVEEEQPKEAEEEEEKEEKEKEKIEQKKDLTELNAESKEKDKTGSRLSFECELKGEEKESQEESSLSTKSVRESSRSRSKSITDDVIENKRRSPSTESEKEKKSKSSASGRDQSSSPERKYKRSKRRSHTYDSDSDGEVAKLDRRSDDEKKNEVRIKSKRKEDDEKSGKGEESENGTISQKIATGLEGLEVEEVSSDNGDDAEFGDKRSLSSLSLSELSNESKKSRSPVQLKKKNKKKKKKLGKLKTGKNYEEGEIDDSEKDNRLDESFEGAKKLDEEVGNENAPKAGEKKRRRSASTSSERQILGSKENKKVTKEKSKDKDLSWKKPSKKDKNYREGKKRSKERGRSRSGDRRKSKSKSPSPKKYKKKNKDRKKKPEKKKELERYDVRKVVKNKEIRKTDAFGRDIISKSRSLSRSRSRSPIRERSRNMLRRDSRSYSRSRSRSFRRGGRSPVRRRYLRSRTRSRSKSIRSVRRSYSRSRSRSRSRKSKKKLKSKDRLKVRSRSRGRKSRSVSRGGRRRSPSRSRTRSPVPRMRSKKSGRARRSWSHHLSRSPSSPRRSRSITRSPVRVRRSYTRSISTRSWSRGRSPLPRTSSLEKLTVVLTTKDKKKKKKEGKKNRKEEKKKKKTGNSKEVFASGDNVLVSVNFRNNNSAGNNVVSSEGRNTRLNSLSPVQETETTRKKKKGSDFENERVTKKSKKSNPISKKVVDVALSSTCPKRAKKLTRLSEKDAEVILNRKPVAVIDLDMSPYREQTPSPVNVVVVSDSGSGDEGKEHTPQRTNTRTTPGREVEVIQENVVSQSANVSAPSSPAENGYVPTSGPKTPPEPQIKFSINKPQQLRQIANPLGDDDDDEDEVEEEVPEPRLESLDRRIEKELNPRIEAPHKGPNTPPAPRGPSTPETPPSPQTSPDAYDPFEPTKSRSPSPSQADKENRPSPKNEGKDDQTSGNAQGDGSNAVVPSSLSENADKINDVIVENHEDKIETLEKVEAIAQVDCSSNVIPSQAACAPGSDIAVNESPERKIGVIITAPPTKGQPQPPQKPYVPVIKQPPIVSTASTAPPTSANLTASSDVFSMPSPTKTSRSGATSTTQTLQVTGIQRLQHRLGSPVNRTPNSVKSTPDKRSTPRTEANEVMSSGSFINRNASKRNGEQPKQPRPLQDATNETIDMTMDLDDSPYSPASSEGDDLFDPPVEPPKPSNSKPAPSYKAVSKPPHKSPVKQLSKFDLLFGPCGPALSPIKAGSKKPNAKVPPKTSVAPKILPQKPPKKALPTNKKNMMHKMDEDQLRILDDLPSSAVELQVKDKFLKKLNRQERVVDEVKTVLKPHYARKHITKEEYKDILRRSVPKICHSRSGEINPSKIQSLIEAYVRKFRHAKKKGINAVSKPKSKKTMFS